MVLPHDFAWVAIVTLVALLFYAWTGVFVGRARGRHGVAAPAMTGHPAFERAVRVQANTLEWLAIFVPALWLFAIYANADVGAALGLIWIVGRYLYMQGYIQEAGKRSLGFMVQGAATLVLVFGGLVGAVWSLAHTGVRSLILTRT